MSMSLLDLMMIQVRVAKMPLTKKKFGEMMHDPRITEEEKQRILKQAEMMGGYECLQ